MASRERTAACWSLGLALGLCLSACGSRTNLRDFAQGDAGTSVDSGALPTEPTGKASVTSEPPPPPPPAPPRARHVNFAVIGDFGAAGLDEGRVADLIKSRDPDFIITTGDNNYPDGAAETIDANIGQYFHAFIAPYRGTFGEGAKRNRFFPSLGNHDWRAPNAAPYLDYFELPNNERYYDVVRGSVHLFAIDSDPHEPDGIDPESIQAKWLKGALEASSSPWKVVYFHHPPYSSGSHGPTIGMRWPFRAWGVSIVYAGHDHHYERFSVEGVPYVVNGVGGNELYPLGARPPESLAGFDDAHGAVFVEASEHRFASRFVSTDGTTLDELVLSSP
jgi:tartrate-resistant acid phosphatase type 5